MIPPRGRFPVLSVAVVGALALLAGAAVLAAVAYAQGEEATCSTGVAVSNPASNPDLVSDCEALLASKDTLAGDATLDWSADTPMTGWDGVTVGRLPARVIRLALQDRGLTGEIPAELGSLANLQTLDLRDNELRGGIPAELGGLANLQAMYLDGNELSGAIPAELEGLSNLEWLFLAGNQLTGCISDGLRHVQSNDLGTLGLPNCSEVALTALYNATGGANWTNDTKWLSDRPLGEWYGVTTDDRGRVTEVNLHLNGLVGMVPPELGSLASLRVLDLWGNELTRLPQEIGNLSRLRLLNLNGNELTGDIQPWLGRLTELRTLELSINQLTGEIPAELGELTNLSFLSLEGNELTGVPPELGRLSNLETLNLGHNPLTRVPPELGDLAQLRYLRLASNKLKGEIPSGSVGSAG